jgi:lambda family phage portal protein
MSAYLAASLDHPDLRRWQPASASADADLLPERQTMAARSRDLARNSGVAEGALQTITDNVIGVGLRLVSTPDYRLLGKTKEWAEEWSTQVESLWRTWAESMDCDAGRSLDFTGLTVQMFRSGWLNGEGLALPLWFSRPGAKFNLRLQVIEPDRLSNPQGRIDGPRLRGGIEIDEYGAPMAYHIQRAHPGDRAMAAVADMLTWERVPAFTEWGRRRVIHAHDRERAGQSRGKPSLSAVMRQFKVLKDFTDAELKAAVVNAKVAMVTKSNLSPETVAELLSSNADARQEYESALTERGLSTIAMEDGQIIPLALGEDLAGFTPARPSGSFDPFVTSIFRHIATGLNIPYELLMKDFSRTNYSSARAALIEAWRFFRGRRQWISTYWARPVFELWLEEAVNLGLVEAPDFYENLAAYARCRWIGPGRGWIDPTKEADAAKIRMDSSLSTLEAECAEQGLDWEEVLEQRAAEKARMQELGLLPTTAPTPIDKRDYPSDKEPPVVAEDEPGEKPKTEAAAVAPNFSPVMNFGQPSISLAVTVPSRPAGRMSFVRNEDGSVEMTELAPDSAED